jgi:hypothetical protein
MVKILTVTRPAAKSGENTKNQHPLMSVDSFHNGHYRTFEVKKGISLILLNNLFGNI